ncbi:MAG: glycosyltransferase family 2 protein [Anaerolineales bacterium]
MQLDVVILNWNAPDDTLACLRDLARWEATPLRLWVVDNASADNSVARLRSAFPHVVVLASDRNRGFAGGNNLALRRALDAGATHILLLNNDATIAESDLRRLMAHLDARSDLGILGPTLWDADAPERLLSAGGRDIVRHMVSHVRDLPAEGEARIVDYVPGTCALIRAEVLRQVGLFDAEYFFGGEMADLCARARQAGWASAVAGDARALHRVARSSRLRAQLHIYYVLRNRFLFIRKFYRRTRWRWRLVWTGYGLYMALLALAHRQPRRARAILLGVLDGWRGRYGGQNARVLGQEN